MHFWGLVEVMELPNAYIGSMVYSLIEESAGVYIVRRVVLLRDSTMTGTTSNRAFSSLAGSVELGTGCDGRLGGGDCGSGSIAADVLALVRVVGQRLPWLIPAMLMIVGQGLLGQGQGVSRLTLMMLTAQPCWASAAADAHDAHWHGDCWVRERRG